MKKAGAAACFSAGLFTMGGHLQPSHDHDCLSATPKEETHRLCMSQSAAVSFLFLTLNSVMEHDSSEEDFEDFVCPEEYSENLNFPDCAELKRKLNYCHVLKSKTKVFTTCDHPCRGEWENNSNGSGHCSVSNSRKKKPGEETSWRRN